MSSLGDNDNFPFLETTEPLIYNPPASGTVGALPLRPSTTSSSGCRNRSSVSSHFTIESGCDKKERCNYCGSLIKCADGTSAMHAHLKRCKDNPNKEENKRQKTVACTSKSAEGHGGSGASGIGSSSTYFKFDQEISHNELVKMFVIAELPFRFVENEGFRKFLSVLQPRFSVPSRTTLARDIMTLFNMERTKLKKVLSKHCRRVCLTTDTWTSCQNFNYMCLTAHFIDNNWKLHKKVLNFCQVTSHSGEVMAKSVEICLNGWDLNRVFSLTIDNASSNDLGIQSLRKRLMSWNSLILRGEYIHMHCCAHILSLIVKEGLKEIDDSVLRIRGAVKYIRSSPSRLSRFKTCAEQEKIAYKGLVCLDVETRWNTTYLMLEAALKHQKAFELLEMQDNKYVEELSREKGKGVPLEDDWDYSRTILPFLKIFYNSTIRISGTSSYVTSNMYMKEVFGIGKKISQYCESTDVSMRLMAGKMRRKYEKYWGNPNGINILLLIAVVLDPRHKLEYVNWFIDCFFDSDKAAELQSKLFSCLKSLYVQYQGNEEGSQSDQRDTQIDEDDDDPYYVGLYLQSTGRKLDAKSELDKYLKEDCEPYNRFVELDILNWWKINSTQFPILANIAREVLAIPVSTVASEFAFSTGGRVLDPYRSSLTPKMVEALVCTNDWVKATPFALLSNEYFEDLENFEQEMVSQHEVAYSTAITLDD